MDDQLSQNLNYFLHHHRLPYVDAIVYAKAGTPRSIALSGEVRTETGRDDAETKSRDFLGIQSLNVSNAVRINPELTSNLQPVDPANGAVQIELQSITFMNTTKEGVALSGVDNQFDANKVQFIEWLTTFDNRVVTPDAKRYYVVAAYLAPDGSMLGSVHDVATVTADQKEVTFQGRVGNSAGGAFPPGQYRVNFFLDGQYFAHREFWVIEPGSR